MTTFCSIFEVNSSIGKLWDLLGYFDKKDMVDFNEYSKCVFLPKSCETFPLGF